MAKWPDNKGKHWTPQEKQAIRQMARENTPTRVMGLKLGRTPEAVQQKASNMGVSLKPPNQSPYGTKKK